MYISEILEQSNSVPNIEVGVTLLLYGMFAARFHSSVQVERFGLWIFACHVEVL